MGFPSPAKDYLEDRINLNDVLVKHPLSTFYLRCEGDSMVEAFIPPRAMLIVDRSINPTDGSIIVAVLNGEFLVRRYRPLLEGCILEPANDKYKDIKISQEIDFTVWGTVTGIISTTKDM